MHSTPLYRARLLTHSNLFQSKHANAGLDGRSTPYLEFRMPMRALMLLEMLKSGASHAAPGEAPSNRSVCCFGDVQKAAKGLRLDSSPTAIRYLLGIFSGLGAVSWFEDVHPDLVVLCPQWLINAMACLIREHNGEHAQLLNDLKHDQDAITLFDEAHVRRGIFPVALLEYIWSSSKKMYKALRAQPEDIDALKNILVNFGLICRVRVQRDSTHSPEECYVVPALLADPPPGRNPSSCIRELLEYYPGADKCMCCWDFSESRWLPLHIFERLVGIVMVASRDVVHVFDVVMARGVADIRAGDAVLLLRLHAERWCITAQTVNYEDCPHASAWMLKLVRVGMRRLLRMFRVKVPHKVLIRTPKGNVEYSDLRRAHALVTTTDGHTMRAKELKRKWLPAVYDCKADCCTTKPRSSTWTRPKKPSRMRSKSASFIASASSSGTQTKPSKVSRRSSSRRSSKTASSKSMSSAASSSVVIPTWTPDPPPTLTSDPTSSSSVSEIPPAKAAFSTFTAEPTSSAGKRESSAAAPPQQQSASASGMPAVASAAPGSTAHALAVMSLSATPAATKDSQECTSDPTSSTSIAPVSQNVQWTPDPTSSTSAVGTPAPRSTSPPLTSDPTSSSSESPIISFLEAAEPEPNSTGASVPASTLPPNPPKLTAQQPQPASGAKTPAGVVTTVATWTPDPTSSTSAKATPSIASTTALTPDPTSSTSLTQSPSPLRPSPRHSARAASSSAKATAFSPRTITTAPPFTPQTIARGRVNFTNLQLLAAGGFGQVYKGTCTSKKFKHGSFALKRQSLYVQQPKNIKDLIRRQKARLETVQREAKIYFSPALNTGKCPHLAMLFDIALVKHPDGSKEPLMVLAWADAHPHNTLRKWINANRFAHVSELRTRLSFAIQMFSGLVQLHSSGQQNPNDPHTGFVHQDLKPANILLYGQGSAPLRLAITDFGLSTSPGRHAKVADGTRSYRSPEQWRKLRALSPSRDMWAASLILTELFGRQKTLIARKKYNQLCKEFKNHESRVDVQQLVTFALGISSAIAEDARQCEPALQGVQKRVIALTKRNFCLDAEIEGRVDSVNSRWTSLRCKTHLEHTWAHVFRELPWTQYYSQIPLPKRSLFESLPKNFRSSLYHDLMEDNILRMLLHRYRKIYREVSFGERAVVEREMESLRRQRRHAKRKRRMLQDKFIMHLVTSASDWQGGVGMNIWVGGVRMNIWVGGGGDEYRGWGHPLFVR